MSPEVLTRQFSLPLRYKEAIETTLFLPVSSHPLSATPDKAQDWGAETLGFRVIFFWLLKHFTVFGVFPQFPTPIP